MPSGPVMRERRPATRPGSSASSHSDDPFYSRWSREALTGWNDLADAIGERLFVPAGVLWLAHDEGGWEASSEATLRTEGIPVERLSPDDLAARWPQMRSDDLAFAIFEPEAGLLMARRGVAAVARTFGEEGGRVRARLGRAGRDRRAPAARRQCWAMAVAAPRPSSCSPQARGCRVSSPTCVGDLVRVTKQDVLFVGSPAGDGRFAAESLPCWLDSDGAVYGLPAVDGRGMKVGPDRYGPPFDPTDGERIVDPESVEIVRVATWPCASPTWPTRRSSRRASASTRRRRTASSSSTAIPDFDNVWLVGGGSGHGFKHGPVIGRYVVGADQRRGVGPGEERFRLDRPRTRSDNPRTRLVRHRPGLDLAAEVVKSLSMRSAERRSDGRLRGKTVGRVGRSARSSPRASG